MPLMTSIGDTRLCIHWLPSSEPEEMTLRDFARLMPHLPAALFLDIVETLARGMPWSGPLEAREPALIYALHQRWP